MSGAMATYVCATYRMQNENRLSNFGICFDFTWVCSAQCSAGRRVSRA